MYLFRRTASQVCLMKFSPDGEFFATAGKVNFLLFHTNSDSFFFFFLSQVF